MNYRKRRSILQEKLKEQQLDALLVSQPENRRYLSGYIGGDHGIIESSGVLVVPQEGKTILLTDFRFQLQAEQETEDLDIQLYPKNLLSLLGDLLPKLGIERLGFEAGYTLHSVARKMTETLAEKGVQLFATERIVEDMRLVKDEDEIAALKRSVLLNERVFEDIYRDLDTFTTEIDVALAVESAMRRYGAERPSFTTIVASAGNGALPHAVPSNDAIQRDEGLTIDMGLVLDGYCSDMTRSFVPREPSKKYVELHRIVRKAQKAGADAIRAGVPCRDADKCAREVIAQAGYAEYFGHSLGHGVGLAVHEAPSVSAHCLTTLQPGMIVTVEPGIYIPGWGGIRLENMGVVREDGFENFNENETWLDI
ncbi:MAG: peptidase M24 [Deltaproteobacteria bacterium]|nr:MAG: peptidase M24 [Deltaproteobacteria bacterium]